MSELSGNAIVVEVIGGRSRAFVEEATLLSVSTVGAPCRISGTMDNNGNWTSGPTCVSNGCTATCTLKSQTDGARTRYWCECS